MSKPLYRDEMRFGYLTSRLEPCRKNCQASTLYGVSTRFLLSSRALLSPVILVSTSSTFVALLVGAGGASPAAVPIAAEGGTRRVDESPLIALVAPGFGTIPDGVGAALAGVMRVGGQAQCTDWEALRGCAGLKNLTLGRRLVWRRGSMLVGRPLWGSFWWRA